jgi:hypothetical protein
LALYVDRTKRDLQADDTSSALANLAEVHQIALGMWNRLSCKTARKIGF